MKNIKWVNLILAIVLVLSISVGAVAEQTPCVEPEIEFEVEQVSEELTGEMPAVVEEQEPEVTPAPETEEVAEETPTSEAAEETVAPETVEETPAPETEEVTEDTPAPVNGEETEDTAEETPAAETEETVEETPVPETEETVETVEETSAPETEEATEETPAPVTEEETEETPAPETEETAEETPAPETEEATEETPAPVTEEETEETPAPEAEEETEETAEPETEEETVEEVAEPEEDTVDAGEETEEEENAELLPVIFTIRLEKRVDVRQQPNGMSALIAHYSENGLLRVVEDMGDWYKVKLDRTIGETYYDYGYVYRWDVETAPVETPKSVSIFTSARETMVLGETIHLSSVLTGFADDANVLYQWQCDRGAGWEDVPGATGASYSFPCTVENMACSWRLVVEF